MAIWPFNRRKRETDVPLEVQEYYQSERRERVGVAWLLAILSLIATVLLVLGLYFGGRWVWNKITDDDDTQTTTQTDTSEETTGTQPEEPAGPSQTDEPSDSEPDTPVSDDGTGSDSLPADGNGTDDADQTAGSAQEDLANTGPRETVAVFIGVTVLGALGHNLYMRRRLARR